MAIREGAEALLLHVWRRYVLILAVKIGPIRYIGISSEFVRHVSLVELVRNYLV